MNLLRSGAKLYDLFFCPRLIIRYLAATVSLHIVYEIATRLKRLILHLTLQFTTQGRQIQNLQRQIRKAKSFEERQAIGSTLDKLEGKDIWRHEAESPLYEYKRYCPPLPSRR